MTTIGAAWLKQKENGEYYQSVNFDKAILPLTITENKRLILKPNKNKTNNEKAPDYYVDIFIPDKTKTKSSNEEDTEFPF